MDDMSGTGWRSMRPVMKCLNCEHPVRRYVPPTFAYRRVYGLSYGFGEPIWVHWGFWQGRRCPGRLTGAEPGEEFGSEDEYVAWVDDRIEARTGCRPEGVA
jgi:hypothetical protein